MPSDDDLKIISDQIWNMLIDLEPDDRDYVLENIGFCLRCGSEIVDDLCSSKDCESNE